MRSQNWNIESLIPTSMLIVTTNHLSMSAPCCVISITFSMPKEYCTKTATHEFGRCLFPKSETIIPSPLRCLALLTWKSSPSSQAKTQSTLFNKTQYLIASMYHNLFSHHSIRGYSSCFHLVLTINIPAVNTLHINLYGLKLLFLWAQFPVGLLIKGYLYLYT